jgi:hypothetical protein
MWSGQGQRKHPALDKDQYFTRHLARGFLSLAVDGPAEPPTQSYQRVPVRQSEVSARRPSDAEPRVLVGDLSQTGFGFRVVHRIGEPSRFLFAMPTVVLIVEKRLIVSHVYISVLPARAASRLIVLWSTFSNRAIALCGSAASSSFVACSCSCFVSFGGRPKRMPAHAPPGATLALIRPRLN